MSDDIVGTGGFRRMGEVGTESLSARAESGPGELEKTVQYGSRLVSNNRRRILWIAILSLLGWVMITVKEVTALLALAYVVALLIDPVLTRLHRYKISRGAAVVLLSTVLIGGCLLFAIFAVPSLLRQYGALVSELPHYVRQLVIATNSVFEAWTGRGLPVNPDEVWVKLTEYSSMVSAEHVKRIGVALGNMLLSGYSVTLTLVNLVLFPFFLYYLAVDLPAFHRSIEALLPVQWRSPVRDTGSEILSHLYAFVRGQLTVSAILILCYICGLLIIGLPSAMIVGFLAGALSVVPYLGVTIGLVLAATITMMTDPTWWAFAKVLIVFGTVQALEGSVLTPRIVGESLGLHPLGVMIVLVVGSQLFGLLGLVVAIPVTASLRVLLQAIFREFEHQPSSDSGIIVASE